mgnify:FL=1
MAKTNILSTRKGRFTSFGILYITEGIPLGFTATAMAAYMRTQGVSATEIGGFLAVLYLPWAFKWAWAPLIDLIPLRRHGGRKTWILGCQIMMVLSLMSFALIDIGNAMSMMIALALINNFFGSLQDVAIDSLAVSTLEKDELGRANGFMFGGAYLGQALGGSGALFLADKFGFMSTFPYIALLLIIVLTLVTRRLHDPICSEVGEPDSGDLLKKMLIQIRVFLRELYAGFFKSGKGPQVGVAFALLPAGAMAISSVTGSTLQVDLGMDQGDIAEISMYAGILSAAGCVAGGWMGDKMGQRRHIALWYACSALPVFYLAWLLNDQEGAGNLTIAQYYPVALIAALITGLYYGVGSAVFMGLTNPLVAATQFTGYMALKNLALSYSNYWQGAAVDELGYSFVFFVDGLVVMLPILLLPFMVPRKKVDSARPMSAPMPEAS